MDDESEVKSVSGVKCQMPELRGEGRAVDLQARAESLWRGWFLHKPCQAWEAAERLRNPQRLISIPLTTGAASDACREME